MLFHCLHAKIGYKVTTIFAHMQELGIIFLFLADDSLDEVVQFGHFFYGGIMSVLGNFGQFLVQIPGSSGLNIILITQ